MNEFVENTICGRENREDIHTIHAYISSQSHLKIFIHTKKHFYLFYFFYLSKKSCISLWPFIRIFYYLIIVVITALLWVTVPYKPAIPSSFHLIILLLLWDALHSFFVVSSFSSNPFVVVVNLIQRHLF